MIVVIAASRTITSVRVMNANTTAQAENHNESTYALLIGSAEKRRNIFEAAIHLLLILGCLMTIWQFARQPVSIPSNGVKETASVVCVDQGKTFGEPCRAQIKGRIEQCNLAEI